MNSYYYDLLQKHINTHTEHSSEDRSAVHYLESVLNPGGRINTSFSCDDKWPNHDGTFEYVSNPEISQRPEQNFIVQIKGTHTFTEHNGEISYSLKSLAFPAYIASEITADGLDSWEINNGFRINEENGLVYIDSYENTTVYILQKLLKLSYMEDREQQR